MIYKEKMTLTEYFDSYFYSLPKDWRCCCERYLNFIMLEYCILLGLFLLYIYPFKRDICFLWL